jgi:UDP-N-acetylmuramate dehydrogenase
MALIDAESIGRVAGLKNVQILTNEPLSKHTSLGVGGPADFFVIPHSIAALAELIRYATDAGVPYLVLGEGTNIIVRDAGVRGMVIRIADNLSEIHRDGTQVTAQAGARVAMLCRRCCEWGLTGLEFAGGIPGSVGGAVVMNAGAYEGEMRQVVDWVTAIKPSGKIERLTRDELGLRYRDSIFQHEDLIVAEVGFLLDKGKAREIRARTYEIVECRCSMQPLARRSAGSVFKRPDGDYAGRLLEAIGAKGLQVGGAMISQKHANFIVNGGGATASDILRLIELVQKRVQERFGIRLEPEVMVVGEADTPEASDTDTE